MPGKMDFAGNVATVAVACCALAVGGLRIREEVRAAPDTTRPVPIENWSQYATSGHRIGPVDAEVTIVEFADFQCTYCRRAAPELRRLREQYPDRLAVVFRHYPLEGNFHAIPAARAAECAAAAGRFVEYHDQLWAQADSIGKKDWVAIAVDAGVDSLEGFQACVQSSLPVAAIDRDTVAGNQLGVPGTPTFLINDKRVAGYRGPGHLEDLVREALAQSH